MGAETIITTGTGGCGVGVVDGEPSVEYPAIPKMRMTPAGPVVVDDFFGDDSGVVVPPHRDPVILREQVILQLRKIIDPDLFQDIVTLGFVKQLEIDYDAGTVNFTLELTTPACPVKEQFVAEAERLLLELGWVLTVNVTLTARQHISSHSAESVNLKDVSFIISVASCKGGVGKSSTCVNLAYTLKRLGASVGIVDADVYGPSLGHLVPIKDPRIFYDSKAKGKDEVTRQVQEGSSAKNPSGGLVPLNHNGISLMSYGYFRPDSDAYAAVRGPMASGIATEMITQTKWGSLDYLLIDLPPGSGDIHLSLAQSIRITASLVVTTPQQLSLADVEKGIHFFNNLKIPTVALVENMAFLKCAKCGEQQDVFNSVGVFDLETKTMQRGPERGGDRDMERGGDTAVSPKSEEECCENKKETDVCCGGSSSSKSKKAKTAVSELIEQFGIRTHARFPLDQRLSATHFRTESGEIGFPFTNIAKENDDLFLLFKGLAQSVARECSALKYSEGHNVPDLVTTPDGMLVITRQSMTSPSGGFTQSIQQVPQRNVRLACRCAACVDEVSGKQRLMPRNVPLDVCILDMKKTGNYAVTIKWSDKHSSLVSFSSLEKLSNDAINDRGGKVGGRCQEGSPDHEW